MTLRIADHVTPGWEPSRPPGSQSVKPSTCWADINSELSSRRLECSKLGTDRLGLCPHHAAELLG